MELDENVSRLGHLEGSILKIEQLVEMLKTYENFE